MSNKVYKKVNKYNIGSWLQKNAGGVSAALGGAASLISDLQSYLAGNQDAINNTKAGINQVNNTTFNAGNTSSLMSQWSLANRMDPVTSKQLRSDKGALDVLTGAATGLSAGAALGPVGTLVGTLAGAASGAARWIGGKSNAKRRENKYNKQIAQANNRLDRNFETARDNLEEQQLNNALMNYAAYGGPLETNGITWPSKLMFINSGGTHEQNPNEGIQIGVDNQGVPNLVEEGEIIYGDYVFSNRLKVPKKSKDELKLGKKDITFADAVEKFAKESEERPNDPISKLGLEANLNKLIGSQEEVRNKHSKSNINNNNMFDMGGPTLLRYAPIVGNTLGLLSNKADYSNADLISRNIDSLPTIKHTPLDNYLPYNPMDINYMANKLNAQSSATRRSILNNSSGNRGLANASLLAADLNALTSMGDIYRQALEYNQAQKQQVATFNRTTNQANAEMGLRADMANADIAKTKLNAKMQEANMREQIANQTAAAKSANLTGLFDNLGAIGKEQTMIDMFNNNPYLLYEVLTGNYKKACGGKIKRRRK